MCGTTVRIPFTEWETVARFLFVFSRESSSDVDLDECWTVDYSVYGESHAVKNRGIVVGATATC